MGEITTKLDKKMLPSIVEKLPLASKNRFKLAFSNRLRPIGIGEPDDIAIGLVQAWLNALDIPLPKSTSRNPDGSITADGIFGSETHGAVKQFQARNGLKPDGMVGKDTLDKIAEKLGEKFHKPRQTEPDRKAGVIVVKRPFRCPPDSLICPEPPHN